VSGAEFWAEDMSSKRRGYGRDSRNCCTGSDAGCAQEMEPLLRRGRVEEGGQSSRGEVRQPLHNLLEINFTFMTKPEDTAGLSANEGEEPFVCATNHDHGKFRLRVETPQRRHGIGPPRDG